MENGLRRSYLRFLSFSFVAICEEKVKTIYYQFFSFIRLCLVSVYIFCVSDAGHYIDIVRMRDVI